jgi:hypothetical protein
MIKGLVATLVCVTTALAGPAMVVPSNGDGLTVSLREALPLELRYDVGETIYYRLVRHTTYFSTDGSQFGGHRAIAYFTRTRLDNDGEGKVRERFEWKSFSFGETLDQNKPLLMSYLKEVENFSLTCSVQDEDMISKFDFSALPRTLEGIWFMIMSWDAVTFDGFVRSQDHFPMPDAAPIGTEVQSTRGAFDFMFEYPPIVNSSKYSFSGKSSCTLVGVGLVKGTPCAIVDFASLENTITMNLVFDPVTVRMRGFEHIWGRTWLSLKDGRIVKGELAAPVIQIQDIDMPGQGAPQRVQYLSLQRLEVEMLSREEFETEAAKGHTQTD